MIQYSDIRHCFKVFPFCASPKSTLDLLKALHDVDTTILNQIAADFGAPLYVYDSARIQSQFERLTEAFKSVPS